MRTNQVHVINPQQLPPWAWQGGRTVIVLSGASAQREIMVHYVRIHHLERIGKDEAREGRARLGIPPIDKREREGLGERSEREREREREAHARLGIPHIYPQK